MAKGVLKQLALKIRDWLLIKRGGGLQNWKASQFYPYIKERGGGEREF